MADDRLTGWAGNVEDFYDLLDEELVRETELSADYVDSVLDDGVGVADLAAGVKSWRYGHVIVDEAQELTPMQWRMINRRSEAGGVTIVGDLAQKSSGMVKSWDELMGDQIGDFNYHELKINYRSPVEVVEVARAILDEMGIEVPPTEAIREANMPVVEVQVSQTELAALVSQQLSELSAGGRLAVICLNDVRAQSLSVVLDSKAEVLSAHKAKGLEFDSVIVIEPDAFRAAGRLSDLFVAVTRSTNRLTLVT